jgi:flagellar biogenesis protein FliO
VGLRSELLIVNVEGQRLLIGVTPHSIQSLAMLEGDEDASPQRNEDAPALEQPVGERFAAVLKSAETRSEGHRPKLPAAPEDTHVAGQARGLLGLRRQG